MSPIIDIRVGDVVVNAGMLLKGWRVAVIVTAVLAAVITPTADPVNMGIFMVPLFGLYLLSIGLAALAGKRKRLNRNRRKRVRFN